jgi:predicted esterase
MSQAGAVEFEAASFPVTLDARYLLHVPKVMPEKPLLAILTHGYGMTPEEMLHLTLPAIGPNHIVASIEAPNQHFLSEKPGSGAVGFNWGTPGRWQSVVRMHHDMVLGILDACQRRFSLPADRTLLIGFSQPVGLNYRLVATYPEAFAGVIGVCGGIPRDWEDSSYKTVRAAILHLARDQDEYYPNDLVEKFPERLRQRASDVEFHLLPGRHRFPSNAAGVVQPWIERVFGG